MEVVYFPEELNARAPSTIGALLYVPTNEWVTLFDVVDMVRTGDPVTIRHASQREVARAEQFVVLWEIGQELSQCIGKLLDHEPPEVADQHRAHLAEVMMSANLPSLNLIQEDAAQEAAVGIDAPAVAQADPFASLPELYAALHCAHIAGNHDDVAQLDAAIQSILRGPADPASVADLVLTPSGAAAQ
ncbi:hypothetical protein [Agrobacterium tumefaciens]|uniref:hypothetical protein n=1 Tax=Agrobacterium tumefaciens TaxID=358 RepID=UPI001572323F|nr:hypothetical protein [Agrobacterium tumefaciens]NTB05800.1 hypothetical protein [Agrobacterium tumefaciens]